MKKLNLWKVALSLWIALGLMSTLGCSLSEVNSKESKPRLSLFIGVDISGSFQKGPYYDDSIRFLAHYLYAHLEGLGGLEKPNKLFVGSIGGAKVGEAKTFYPIQTFEDKTVTELDETLRQIFPPNVSNPYTDFNAFFEKVALTVKSKNLVLRPISIVMLSDGVPDVNLKKGESEYRSIEVKPLEMLARSVTLRVLYTDAVVGANWQQGVPRKRVKVWTQDAQVMTSWRDPKIMVPGKNIEEQEKFFAWIKDNVDFGVRSKRVL